MLDQLLGGNPELLAQVMKATQNMTSEEITNFLMEEDDIPALPVKRVQTLLKILNNPKQPEPLTLNELVYYCYKEGYMEAMYKMKAIPALKNVITHSKLSSIKSKLCYFFLFSTVF